MSLGVGTVASRGLSLGDLVAAVEQFAYGFRPAEEPSELGSQLVLLRSTMDRLEVVFAHAAGTFAATDEWEEQGATSAIQWLRHNAKMTSTAAAERICIGEQLQHMPQFVESLFEGKLGFGHVVHAARAAQKLSCSDTGEGFDESDLLEPAVGMSVGKFGYAVRHYLHSKDPHGVRTDEVAAAEMREASVTTGADGWVHLRASLDPEGGAIVRTVLETLGRLQNAEDDRLYGQRMADALVEGMKHSMDLGAMSTRGGQRVHLQVTASYETLMAAAGAPGAEMALSLPISGEKARRQACDCSFTRILLNSDSIPIDVGREKRVISGAIRKAVHLQYPECGFTGCDRPASWCEGHHIVHWINGGRTIVENIVPLCFRHHFMVHEGGWTIEKTDVGLAFLPPAGNRVRFVRHDPQERRYSGDLPERPRDVIPNENRLQLAQRQPRPVTHAGLG